MHDELVLSVLQATQLDTLDARGARESQGGKDDHWGMARFENGETVGRGARNHHA